VVHKTLRVGFIVAHSNFDFVFRQHFEGYFETTW
jgi:hypothetical protein